MGTVRKLANEVERGRREGLPRLRKTMVKKRALAVGAMLEGQIPNTVELANGLRWKRRVRIGANKGCAGC